VSAGKLEKRFTPEAMAKAHEKAKAEGKDSEVEFLVMVPTKQTLSAEKPASAETTTKENDALTKLLMRTDVKGIDVAAPEAQEFTKTGMDWLVEKYKLLDRVAQSKGQKMVLRPHVGEGYDPAGTGEHVAIARKNLEMLVKTLEKLGYDGSGNVIVRLGHATHATPEILADMARIGVIVESNVGSNLATGSILRAEEHPLLLNMYYGVKTVLATDAQGVMGTTLPAEYQRAAFLIDRFKAGEPLVVKGKTIYYRDLDAAQQKRFSVDWLKQQLDGYRRSSQLPVKRTAN
jgi:adenosine deaminase